MHTLFSHLKPYRKECVLGPLLKLAEATLELFVPMVVAAVIDRGIDGAEQGYIVRMSLVLVGLGLLGLLFSVTAQFFSARAAVGFVTRLRHALYAHVQRFPFATLDRIGIPTLITRMSSDMNQVQTGLNLTLRLLLRSPFVVFGAMIMAFTIDATAALWFAAAIPVLALIVFGIMLLTMPMYKKVQERLDRVLGLTRENLNGVRVLRAFRKEEDECQTFEAKNGELTAAQQRVGRVSALMNPLTYVVVNLAVILLIRTGALRVQAGILTQGAVVALYNYMSQILVELIKLANLIINITKSLACGRRIQAILDVEDEESVIPELPGGDPTVRVELDHASLRYAGAGGEALSDVTLRAYPGQVIGVIGGTGSGKSTLVNLIPRFYEATAGRVLVDGKDVRSLDPAALRAKIGIVPQKAVLFRGTIRDNLLWGSPPISDTPHRDGTLPSGSPTSDTPRRDGTLPSGSTQANDRPQGDICQVRQENDTINGNSEDGICLRQMRSCRTPDGKVPSLQQTISDEDLLEALEMAQASEVVAGKGGLDGEIEQFGRNLSGGQRQRLTIARALVRKPEILILDDSSSALDFATDAALRKALLSLDYAPTVFLVAQRTSAVRHADQIVVLDEGRVVGLGTHDELLETCPVYREIHESQFRKEAAV